MPTIRVPETFSEPSQEEPKHPKPKETGYAPGYESGYSKDNDEDEWPELPKNPDPYEGAEELPKQ